MAHAWVRDSNATLSLGQGLSTSGPRAETGPPSHPIQLSRCLFFYFSRQTSGTYSQQFQPLFINTVVVLPYVRSAFLTWPGVNLCEYKLKHSNVLPLSEE